MFPLIFENVSVFSGRFANYTGRRHVRKHRKFFWNEAWRESIRITSNSMATLSGIVTIFWEKHGRKRARIQQQRYCWHESKKLRGPQALVKHATRFLKNDDENEKVLFGDLTDLLTLIKQTSAAIITKFGIFWTWHMQKLWTWIDPFVLRTIEWLKHLKPKLLERTRWWEGRLIVKEDKFLINVIAKAFRNRSSRRYFLLKVKHGESWKGIKKVS